MLPAMFVADEALQVRQAIDAQFPLPLLGVVFATVVRSPCRCALFQSRAARDVQCIAAPRSTGRRASTGASPYCPCACTWRSRVRAAARLDARLECRARRAVERTSRGHLQRAAMELMGPSRVPFAFKRAGERRCEDGEVRHVDRVVRAMNCSADAFACRPRSAAPSTDSDSVRAFSTRCSTFTLCSSWRRECRCDTLPGVSPARMPLVPLQCSRQVESRRRELCFTVPLISLVPRMSDGRSRRAARGRQAQMRSR